MIREIGPMKYEEAAPAWWGSAVSLGLCPDVLDTWFDIDESKPLYVRIHDRPGKDRLAVTGDDGQTNIYVSTREGIREPIYVNFSWLDIGIPYPYYVEIVQ